MYFEFRKDKKIKETLTVILRPTRGPSNPNRAPCLLPGSSRRQEPLPFPVLSLLSSPLSPASQTEHRQELPRPRREPRAPSRLFPDRAPGGHCHAPSHAQATYTDYAPDRPCNRAEHPTAPRVVEPPATSTPSSVSNASWWSFKRDRYSLPTFFLHETDASMTMKNPPAYLSLPRPPSPLPPSPL
jgi:hypothetical protein